MNLALVILIIALLGGLALAFRLSIFMARRATCNVVKIFRQQNAVKPGTALEVEELDFLHQPFFGLGRALRDYRPGAFQALNQVDVIQATADNRFFLSEEKLSSLKLKCK